MQNCLVLIRKNSFYRPSQQAFVNWPPYTEGRERQKKEAELSRFVGGRFNK